MALTTDATPRIHLEPSQVLKDDHRVKRLIATLSEGIFYDIDSKKASEILQECLKICGGSNETLSQVLQDKFFGDHTPFYWAITNKDPQSHALPLLEELAFYGGALTKETQEDIVEAFRVKFDSVVYSTMKHRLMRVSTLDTCSPSFFQGGEHSPIVTASSEYDGVTTVRFEIPRFFDRLLADGELSLQFYALRATFCLSVSVTRKGDGRSRPRWDFNLAELPPSGHRPMGIYTVLQIHSEDGREKHARSYGGFYHPAPPKMEVDELRLVEFYRTPYTANERGALSGEFTLNKASR
ncbi:hypothetical protein FA13DRAFT_1735674, partial [Coprinellus micaceus]